MTVLERGKVKVYKPDKGYGFVAIIDDAGEWTGEDMFFHVQSRRGVTNSSGVVEFTSYDGIPLGGGHISPPLDDPERGNELVFVRGQGHRGKGIQAVRWSFAELWDDCTARRPTYRLLKAVTSASGHVEMERLFTGYSDSLAELFPWRKYPCGYPRRLAGIQIAYFVERMRSDGTWIECPDPRFNAYRALTESHGEPQPPVFSGGEDWIA